MSMLAQVETDPQPKPPRIVIHGKGGVGKTTFGASAKDPILLPCEDGRGKLKVPTLPRPKDYADVMAAIDELLTAKHKYGTLVVDTIDHFEPLVWAHVCASNSEGKKIYKSIEDFGYGKGFVYADPLWWDFFKGLDALRRERNMAVMVLSHCDTVTIKDPQIGPYDRIQPKLHKRANAIMHEWADVVGYLDIKRYAMMLGEEKGKNVKTATTAGERVLYLEDQGGFVAKNRYGLAPEIAIPEKEPFGALRAEIMKSMKEAA